MPRCAYLVDASRRPLRSLLRLGLDRPRRSRRMVDGARSGSGWARWLAARCLRSARAAQSRASEGDQDAKAPGRRWGGKECFALRASAREGQRRPIRARRSTGFFAEPPTREPGHFRDTVLRPDG
jgi:hypothetical protein